MKLEIGNWKLETLAQTRLPDGGQAWHARIDFIAPVHLVLNGQ